MQRASLFHLEESISRLCPDLFCLRKVTDTGLQVVSFCINTLGLGRGDGALAALPVV